MAALNKFPRRMLPLVLGFFGRVPADGGRIEKNFCALHGGQARGFGIPLIPADQHADFSVASLPRAKTQIARSEIKLFVEKRVIRNMHLPIKAEQRAVRIDDDSR